MRRVALLVVVWLLGVVVVESCDARWRPLRRRSRVSYNNPVRIQGNAQQVAEQKAAIQASRGACFHPGGGFGGGYAEGVGAGMSAAAACANCCDFSGAIIGQAAVQSSNGMWYACTIYGG